jgi:hypothetical protein
MEGLSKMKRLKFPDEPIWYPEDVTKLRDAAFALGYAVSGINLQKAYSKWSEDKYCAGWLILTNESEIIKDLIDLGYLEEADDLES